MTVRIGIIGAGAIARYAFAPGLAEPGSAAARIAMPDWYHNGSPNAQVVAVASRTRAKAEELAREFGIPRVYDDWRALLADAEIDAVCVTTPNYLHCEMTVAACDAGKHVFVEKPLAMNLQEGRAMVEAAKRANVVLMVHQNQRFFPVHEVAKEILETGIIGPVLSLRARWSHAGPEYWSPEGAWFFDPVRAGHGALFDLGIHKFDVIRYLTGKEAAEVSAFTATLDKKISVEDNGVAMIRFTDGTLGVVEASWTSPPNENSVRLYGTRGYLQVGSDSAYPLSVHLVERPKETYALPAGEWHENVFVPRVPEQSATGGMFRHFVECITTGRACIASGEDNLKSFAMALAAFESAESGQSVRLPLT
ncbi:MAG TPA: Gfo/Idh/MocA family oxidoreductase [Anaerolineae bacterium]|nr:Gfo/Idh/MocA family oxidoreductase [Anaerolineae bacterium]